MTATNVTITPESEYNANGERVEIEAVEDGTAIVHHKDRATVSGDPYKATRPVESVEAVIDRENWELITAENPDPPTIGDSEVVHPDFVNTFTCEQCNTLVSQDSVCNHTDAGGHMWHVCSDCGGEYDRVFVKSTDQGYAVTKANHHVISRHPTYHKALRKAEQIGFRVENR